MHGDCMPGGWKENGTNNYSIYCIEGGITWAVN